MSRIWAALPIIEDPNDPKYQPMPTGCAWWRIALTAVLDGAHQLIIRTDTRTTIEAARLGCWEFFDELDEQSIYGVDVFRVRQIVDGYRPFLDVLAPDVPTASQRWMNLTEPEYMGAQHVGFLPMPFDYSPVWHG